MLVLTRKLKEQIRIGDDITITIVRLQGNSVRIGIDAPREMRVVRGELSPKETESEQETIDPSERERVFAHPQPKPSKRSRMDRVTKSIGVSDSINRVADSDGSSPTRPQLFVGNVGRDGGDPEMRPAPLSGFMSAT
ncbi:MAG: carbon storage regulator [Planctomycetota bacterium]